MGYASEELKRKNYKDLIKVLDVVTTLKALSQANVAPLLADGFYKIEIRELRVEEVIMNARTFQAVKKMGRDHLDYEYDKKILVQGIVAYLWGASITVLKEIPDKTILLISGEMTIPTEQMPPSRRIATILNLEFESVSSLKELAILNTDLKNLLLDITDSTNLNGVQKRKLKQATAKQKRMDQIIYDLTKEEKEHE